MYTSQGGDSSAGGSSEVLTGLNPGTTYEIRVAACNSVGFGHWSDGTTITTASTSGGGGNGATVGTTTNSGCGIAGRGTAGTPAAPAQPTVEARSATQIFRRMDRSRQRRFTDPRLRHPVHPVRRDRRRSIWERLERDRHRIDRGHGVSDPGCSVQRGRLGRLVPGNYLANAERHIWQRRRRRQAAVRLPPPAETRRRAAPVPRAPRLRPLSRCRARLQSA